MEFHSVYYTEKKIWQGRKAPCFLQTVSSKLFPLTGHKNTIFQAPPVMKLGAKWPNSRQLNVLEHCVTLSEWIFRIFCTFPQLFPPFYLYNIGPLFKMKMSIDERSVDPSVTIWRVVQRKWSNIHVMVIIVKSKFSLCFIMLSHWNSRAID